MRFRLRLVCFTVLFGAALALGLRFLFPFVGPFLVGIVAASLIEPGVAWCERVLGLPRRWGSALILLLGVGSAGVLLAAVSFQVFQGLRELTAGEAGREALARWAGFLETGAGWLRGLPAPLREAAAAALRLLPQRLGESLQGLLFRLGRFSEWMGAVLLGLLIAYFISRDRALLGRFLLRLIPAEWRGRAFGIARELAGHLTRLLEAQLVLVGLTFILSAAGFLLLGIGRPWLAGAIIGYLDLLPLVGPGAIILPWAGFRLAMGDWVKGLGLAALFFLLAFVREAAEAKLLGESLALHPLATMAAVYLGLRFFGWFGMILGPLLFVFLRTFHRALVSAGGFGEEVFREG